MDGRKRSIAEMVDGQGTASGQYADCSNLIIVCCHATYLGDGLITDESEWILEDFQRSDASVGKPSEHDTFIHHIITGALAVENDLSALLIFSGGTTAKERVRSEAEGYESIYVGLVSKLLRGECERYALEPYATDSYQNLLFSILRFRILTGRYPKHIKVITHAFKERRFLTLHAAAIKWPAHRIRIMGINPPFTLQELQETQRGEFNKGYGRFERDLYGVGEMLGAKRSARNWDPRVGEEAYGGLEDEVALLLAWVRTLIPTLFIGLKHLLIFVLCTM